MAGKFILQSVLWIAAAIVLSGPLATSATGDPETPTVAPTVNSSMNPTANSTMNPTANSTMNTTANSTMDPTANSTMDPTANSTMDPTANSTMDPTANSTAAPTAGPSTAAPTPPSNPCDANPCGQGSTCEPRADQTFVCLCLPGTNYNNSTKSCEPAKVFPGELNLNSITYVEAMGNKESPEFQKTSKDITDALNKTFKTDITYTGSTVLELLPISETRSPGVKASVEMFFKANSEITTSEVTNTLKDAKEGVLEGSTFTETDLCVRGACDASTTICKAGNGIFNCTCNQNYVPTSFSDRVCVACPSGSQAVDAVCEPCSFGHSGLNCSENWKLILVIVGSVLGALLLIALILLPVVASKSKKNSKKDRSEDIGKPYTSHSPAKAPLAYSFSNSHPVSVSGSGNGVSGFASTGVQKIPRATANSSWDSRANLEMTPSNSRQNLMGKDDFNPYSRSMNSLNSQARPQSNPYAQNRPQGNPYAQSQGYNNPYYSQDEGRRF